MVGKGFESLADRKVWAKAMRHLRKRDVKLARLISRYGIVHHEWGPRNPYEAIVGAFIYQQISGKAAEAILERFKALYNGRLPTPREFLRTPEKRVRSAGISPQKYSYIKGLCKRLVGNELDLKGLAKLPDEEVIAVLDDVKGIGRWTAEMFLMFSLRRVDVFPMDDLGIRSAFGRIYGAGRGRSEERMLEVSSRWAPYRSIAALYLWRSQD